MVFIDKINALAFTLLILFAFFFTSFLSTKYHLSAQEYESEYEDEYYEYDDEGEGEYYDNDDDDDDEYEYDDNNYKRRNRNSDRDNEKNQDSKKDIRSKNTTQEENTHSNKDIYKAFFIGLSYPNGKVKISSKDKIKDDDTPCTNCIVTEKLYQPTSAFGVNAGLSLSVLDNNLRMYLAYNNWYISDSESNIKEGLLQNIRFMTDFDFFSTTFFWSIGLGLSKLQLKLKDDPAVIKKINGLSLIYGFGYALDINDYLRIKVNYMNISFDDDDKDDETKICSPSDPSDPTATISCQSADRKIMTTFDGLSFGLDISY